MGAYSSAILGTSGLISYWRMNEPSGTTAYDLGPNAYNLAYVNSPSLNQSGPFVNSDSASVKFTAASTNYCGVTTGATGYSSLSAITYEGWMKYVTGATYAYVVSTGNSGLRVNEPTLGFFLTLGGTLRGVNTPSATTITDGNWHQMVGTYSGSTMLIYYDGAQVANVNYSGTTASIAQMATGANPGGEWSNSYTAEVAIYNRALTGAEVLYHYNLGIGVIANDGRSRPGRTLQAVKRAATF